MRADDYGVSRAATKKPGTEARQVTLLIFREVAAGTLEPSTRTDDESAGRPTALHRGR